MNRHVAPMLRAVLLLGAALALPGVARAGPKMLPDSTWIESWQLANGLKVVTHSIPRCPAIAITVAYPAGTDADPADRRGLAQLMAELQMMAPAGDVPERSRREMESLRALGWSLKVGRRATQLSEVASLAQFPGALRQVATRMRGVTVSAPVLKSAIASVRRDLGEHLFGTVDNALYYQVREAARGAEPNAAVALAAAKGLDALSASEVEQRLHATLVPGGAVLALAGDLSRVNAHALVESQFGSLPAGAAAADPPAPAFRPGFRSVARPDVDAPIGVLAVNAPALSDSGHPGFFLSMLLIAEHCHQSWPITPTLKTRFRYSLLDEPDLVRFYPLISPDSTGAHALATELYQTLGGLMAMTVVRNEYDKLRYSVLWLLGGPMPPPVLEQVRGNGAALNNLCNSLAARELLGGETFWAGYRLRFLSEDARLARWARWASLPEHQSGLLFTPLGKGRSAR